MHTPTAARCESSHDARAHASSTRHGSQRLSLHCPTPRCLAHTLPLAPRQQRHARWPRPRADPTAAAPQAGTHASSPHPATPRPLEAFGAACAAHRMKASYGAGKEGSSAPAAAACKGRLFDAPAMRRRHALARVLTQHAGHDARASKAAGTTESHTLAITHATTRHDTRARNTQRRSRAQLNGVSHSNSTRRKVLCKYTTNTPQQPASNARRDTWSLWLVRRCRPGTHAHPRSIACWRRVGRQQHWHDRAATNKHRCTTTPATRARTPRAETQERGRTENNMLDTE